VPSSAAPSDAETYVVDIAPAPDDRVGAVLVAAQHPLLRRRRRRIGERIAWYATQILALAAFRVAGIRPVHEYLQGFRIPVFAGGRAGSRDLAALPVFVKCIDRRADVAQSAPELELLFASDGDLGVGSAAAARMDRMTSVTSSSTSVKPRLFDDDPRRPNLRIERFSARGLDGRSTIDEVGDAGFSRAIPRARAPRYRRRRAAARPRAMFSNPREASAEELNESTAKLALIALT